jgi:hypothetical protein
MSHVPADEECGIIAMQENLKETLNDNLGLQMETDIPDVRLESVRGRRLV